jgi:hypothetical protein
MIVTTVSFITLLVNWCNNGLLPLIRQFFIIPNRSVSFNNRNNLLISQSNKKNCFRPG